MLENLDKGENIADGYLVNPITVLQVFIFQYYIII